MEVTERLVNAIKDYILDCDDVEMTVSELRRYRKEFRHVPDYNWYRYGNILPYYSQMREFLEKEGFSCPEDNEEMCRAFCRATGKAIDLILNEVKREKSI